MKNLLQKMTLKTLTILCVLVTMNSDAQYGVHWARNYGGTSNDIVRDIINTSDGGYIFTGSSFSNDIDLVSPGQGVEDLWIVKLNTLGDILWETRLGGTNYETGYSILELIDGYLIGGTTSSSNGDVSNSVAPLGYDSWLIKIDFNGNIIWEKNYGGSRSEGISKIIQLNDGFLLAGQSNSSDIDINNSYSTFDTVGNYWTTDVWFIKIDSIGNIIWEKSYGGSKDEELVEVFESNNGFVVFSKTRSIDFDLNGSSMSTSANKWIFKIDGNGTIQWSSIQDYQIFNAIKTNDGGFMHYDGSDLVKIDSLGNTEWSKDYTGSNLWIDNLAQDNTNNYFITAWSVDESSNVLCELDGIGNVLSKSKFGSSQVPNNLRVESLLSLNGEFIISFLTNDTTQFLSNNYGGNDVWVFKMKPFIGEIFGEIVLDFNDDCIKDTNDIELANVITYAYNPINSLNYYGFTNAQGDYNISVDTISYMVSMNNPSPYIINSSCSLDSQNTILTSPTFTDTVNFFTTPLVQCPYMEVDVSTIFLRRCRTANYVVSYCNNGTAVANNSFVELEIDPTLVVNNSSIPWTTVVGNTYTFPLGNIAVFDCGTFTINVSIPCDSTTFLGQILCVDAHIFPDTFCLPTPTWSGAELQAKAVCIGTDSVEFSLKNIGNGNMIGDVPVIAIEDVILIMDTLESLNVGDEIKWKFPTNGTSTSRLIAQQPTNHPYKTFTTDAVAYCNLNASSGPPPVQDSAFLAYPNDEEAPFVAIDCQAIIGSFDPNDKTVYPSGVGANHYISETTDLEYKIRFQNTGNDTAFLVVITDSISSNLDITTIHPGASSHPYQFDIFGTGVVKFTFNNILLPDSFVNEPASHGFVQYKISQKTGNQAGDVILNNADIFFDYNLPIRTNTAFSEIGGIFLDTIIYEFPKADGIEEIQNFKLNVYPNPAKDFMYFEFENNQKSITIELFDLSGKLQQKTVGVNTNKIRISRANLSKGMYMFKIYASEKEVAYGKLIFE